MERRLENLVFIIGFVLASLYLTSQVLQGVGLLSGLKVAAVMSPFILAAVASCQHYWVGVAIAMLTMSVKLPIPMINRYPLGVLFAAMVVAFMIAQTAIQKGNRPSKNPAIYLISLAGMIVLGRILYDRPGSARLGASGGLGEAVTYALAFLSFWAFTRYCYKNYNADRFLKPLIVVAILSSMYHLAILVPRGLGSALYSLYHRPIWLLSAIAVALVFHFQVLNKYIATMPFIRLAVIGGTLGMSAVSAHRSRPLFAIAIILIIAWIYGRFKKTLATVALMGVLGVGGLLVVYPSGLPSQVTRSLSTFVPVDAAAFRAEAHRTGISYEVGWTSGFRSIMYQIAWKRIKSSPFVGTGFSFSLKEILDQYYSLSINNGFQGIGALALAGGYHNSVLALAVFCGIPAALAFFVGMMLIVKKFLIYAKKLPPSSDKLLAATLCGFFMAAAGQMLMNGGSFDLFGCCVLCGVMVGILQAQEKQASPGIAPEPTAPAIKSLPPLGGRRISV